MDKAIGNVLLDNASVMKGIFSAHIPNYGATYLEQNFTGVNDLYLSFYLKLNGLPTSSTRMFLISNAGTTVGNIYLMPDGSLRLRNGSSTIGSNSAPLALNTLYRVGIHQKLGSGANAVLEAFLAVGDDVFSSPFARLTNGTWTTLADRVRLGSTTSSATGMDIFTDDIRLDAFKMPDPSTGGPIPPSSTPTSTPTFTPTPTFRGLANSNTNRNRYINANGNTDPHRNEPANSNTNLHCHHHSTNRQLNQRYYI